jgi:hypothetical protein
MALIQLFSKLCFGCGHNETFLIPFSHHFFNGHFSNKQFACQTHKNTVTPLISCGYKNRASVGCWSDRRKHQQKYAILADRQGLVRLYRRPIAVHFTCLMTTDMLKGRIAAGYCLPELV